jgi:hypothetical protein
MPCNAGSARSLLKLIKKPSSIASALDWKKVSGGSILSLDIHRDRIGIAVASHPGFANSSFSELSSGGGSSNCVVLDPIGLYEGHPQRRPPPLARRSKNNSNSKKNQLTSASDALGNYNPHNVFSAALKHECRDKLLEICEQHKVCGVVVAWPLQKDTGRMGAACGRVLYTLEGLFSPDEETIALNGGDQEEVESFAARLPPLCLWDPQHFQEQQRQSPPKDPTHFVDSFGRCPAFGQSCEDKKDLVYHAREEQYHHDESMVATQVWQDFCRVHWPELCEQAEELLIEPPRSSKSSKTLLTTTASPRAEGGRGRSASLVSGRPSTSIANLGGTKTLNPTRTNGTSRNVLPASTGNDQDLDMARLVSW